MSNLPILIVDFDGVLHDHSGDWQGPAYANGPAIPGMEEFLTEAVNHFRVHIFSVRSADPAGNQRMQMFLLKRLPVRVFSMLSFPKEKPPAFVEINDRAITFTGTFPDMETLKAFKPWNTSSET